MYIYEAAALGAATLWALTGLLSAGPAQHLGASACNCTRMGMVTLHNNNTVNTEIESMNVNPRAGNKGALLDNLYDINSDFGTPLRSTARSACCSR